MSELYHFGIKGMKWGVRRYQNEDGSLTSLGKKREQMLSDRKYAKKHPTIPSKVDAVYSRREFEDAKTRLKLENQKKKSKRQLDLEKKYIDQGFTKDEAEIKAYNRAKTEKILKVAGGIALASAAAYVAYKHYDKVTDRVLGQGSKIGRITSDGSESTNRAFYGFVNKHDKKRYEGLYGKALSENGPVYRKAMKAAGDIKVASPESARKVMKNMFDNDKESLGVFKKTVDDLAEIAPNTKQGKLILKAKRELDSGKIGDNTYKAFNSLLVKHDEGYQQINDKFYSAMKKAGYGAIRDVNDKENSGYFAKNPLIIFDTDKIDTEGFTKLGSDYIDKTYGKEIGKVVTHAVAKQTAIPSGAAFAAAMGSMKIAEKSGETKFVSEYRKQHPETKLSNNEILKIKDLRDSHMFD